MPSLKRVTYNSPFKCRYLQYRLQDNSLILLPLIHVQLEATREKINTIALLDTGATSSFLPYEIADILELIPQEPKNEPVETAGGEAEFFPVTLKRLSLIRGGNIFYDFNNLQMLVPAEKERDLPYAILGRDSIFKSFHITFQENLKRYVIVHHKWRVNKEQT